MSLIDKIKAFFSKKQNPAAMEQSPAPSAKETNGTAGNSGRVNKRNNDSSKSVSTDQNKTERIKKKCKECGKTFTVDPSWEHIPNYCKECRLRFAKEKEEKQRAGAPRKIKRTCRNCGRVFTFPNTLEHYPNYCTNCRKNRKQEMKAKYGQPVKREKA